GEPEALLAPQPLVVGEADVGAAGRLQEIAVGEAQPDGLDQRVQDDRRDQQDRRRDVEEPQAPLGALEAGEPARPGEAGGGGGGPGGGRGPPPPRAAPRPPPPPPPRRCAGKVAAYPASFTTSSTRFCIQAATSSGDLSFRVRRSAASFQTWAADTSCAY